MCCVLCVVLCVVRCVLRCALRCVRCVRRLIAKPFPFQNKQIKTKKVETLYSGGGVVNWLFLFFDKNGLARTYHGQRERGGGGGGVGALSSLSFFGITGLGFFSRAYFFCLGKGF